MTDDRKLSAEEREALKKKIKDEKSNDRLHDRKERINLRDTLDDPSRTNGHSKGDDDEE